MIFQPIITGTQLPELINPGTADDLLAGKQLIDQYGNPLTGTIPTNTESNVSVNEASIIIPAGYYGSQVSKSVATATQATPTISVNSSGLITASSTQSAGYVTAGTKSATRQLTTQAGKTITPGRTQQTAVASGRYTTGAVYVAGDSDLLAANIKRGVNIFGVAGTYGTYKFLYVRGRPDTQGTVTLQEYNSPTVGIPAEAQIAGVYIYASTSGSGFTYSSVRSLSYNEYIVVSMFAGRTSNTVYSDWYSNNIVYLGNDGGELVVRTDDFISANNFEIDFYENNKIVVTIDQPGSDGLYYRLSTNNYYYGIVVYIE